jgi:hypothetical protein
MIVLRPTNLHWLDGSTDNPQDLCAHSGVEFQIDGEQLVQGNDGDWTVSAAALYLLRTLSRPHTKTAPVGEHLFPCCGRGFYEVEGEEDAVLVGCNRGIDFEILRVSDDVTTTAKDGLQYRVSFPDWRNAVCGFCDAVRDFYAASSPKEPADADEQRGFELFLSEWSRRRATAERRSAGFG